MSNFDLIKEINKLEIIITGNCLHQKPVKYEDHNYFYTKNFHPEKLKNFIIENKNNIIKWCIKNNRNIESALLGY